jgi:Rps23 Pro-64 3,4-dihydroxylase Tpa1-like proline 4-hydroxylase
MTTAAMMPGWRRSKLLLFGVLQLCWTTHALQSQSPSKLLPSSAYDTIETSSIAVAPNFLPASEVQLLRQDAQNLWAAERFSTDALASYGTTGKFDPTKDRAVLRLQQWKDQSSGNWNARQRFGTRMADLRRDLALHLNRPHLNSGLATTAYGDGSTEISYTRFGPGAFLERHVDEHHEELKGTDGWTKPTRRSISWLIYLNEDWNSSRDGGQLRCFQRTGQVAGTVGALPNGDLQIGWLRGTRMDPIDRPVYMDARTHVHDGNCRLYIQREQTSGSIEYISDDFHAHPILYVAGGDALVRKLLVNRADLAARFHLIEAPKSQVGSLLAFGKNSYLGSGEDPGMDEELRDVDPNGGTLVLFDSVTLPHEVLATRSRDRYSTSGWFHEDQQPAQGSRVPT